MVSNLFENKLTQFSLKVVPTGIYISEMIILPTILFLIEHEYESRYPQQITVVDIPSVERGAKHNFLVIVSICAKRN